MSEATVLLHVRLATVAANCPRQAPTCTYQQWFILYSPSRRYCQLPVSGKRMQRFRSSD